MYLSISLESTQMYSRPVQVQDETEQISPVLPSGGGGEGPGGDREGPGDDGGGPGGAGEGPGGAGEGPGGDGEGPGGDGEGPGGDGDDPGGDGEGLGGDGDDPGATGEDLGGNGEDPGGAGEDPGAVGEDLGAAGEDPDGESAEYFTPVQVEEAAEIHSEISDVEERGYCNFSSQGNIEMNFELVCVESEKIKRLYRNTEKVKFNISTYNLVVYIMINSYVCSSEDINVQSELEMAVSLSIYKSLLIMTCCLLLLHTGLSID